MEEYTRTAPDKKVCSASSQQKAVLDRSVKETDQQYDLRLQTGRVGRRDIGVIEIPQEVQVQSVST